MLFSSNGRNIVSIRGGKGTDTRGAAKNFVQEGPVTDVVRVQSLAVLDEDNFDVTAQFLV